MSKKNKGIRLIAQNKNAHRNYFIEKTYQAGIQLVGTEVKSLRQGKANMKDSFVRIENGEAYLLNAHISSYEQGNIFNVDPLRKRKLLLHKKEIDALEIAIQKSGFTIVAIRMYFNNSLVKVDIGIGRGKKLYDKREDLIKKDAQRTIQREFKDYNK